MARAATVRELRDSGYQTTSVKQELRDNLIGRLKRGEPIFPGIVGYEESVLPQIENAILSGQDIVFLGERGQAKTRMARLLVGLLDDEVPALAGCEINDAPFAPICAACRQRLADKGDAAGIVWLPRDRRYGEKLATPDITIADLIGEVDPIKVAEGRYLADELTIHYGLLPRTNRGIFAINELPDLAERIQVGLLNIMEERDVQIRGYKVRLPLDLYVVASANPEDYTNRGRIITPLKDRFGSQIRTHYPKRLEHEIAIMEAELTRFPADGLASTSGKIELETVGEGGEDKVLGKLVQRAVLNVFGRCFRAGELDEVVAAFQGGLAITVSDTMASAEYMQQIGQVSPLQAAVKKLGSADPASAASALEFILEGLHLSRKLNKDVQAGRARYRGSAGSAATGRD